MSYLRRQIARALLAFDAFVNSTLYESTESFKENYAAFSAFMDRFHIAGWRRVLNELACETLTLGVGLGVLALALAVPAFQETSDDWLKQQDLAVTFLDRYGEEVGRRGIKHDRFGLLRSIAAVFDSGRHRHRGSAVLRPFRH